MNWDDLRVLLALVRSGSLTRASLALGIDQSTVGRRLSALESALGTTLFLRSKTGIIPTETGEKLIADALEIERRTEQIIQTAASPTAEPVGELRIMGEHWVLAHLAQRFLPDLVRSHPKLCVRLIAGSPTAASWTAATISLWFEDPPQMGEFAIKLADVDFALYAPIGSEPDSLGWVALQDDSATRRLPARFLEKLRHRDDIVSVAGNDPGLLQGAMRQGMGKGLLPVCVGDDDPGLQRIGGTEARIARALHIHAHPDTVQSLRVQTAIRLLRENARDIFQPGNDRPGAAVSRGRLRSGIEPGRAA